MLGMIIDGRYRIDSLAGAGGMARVYQGTHTKTGAKLAVKVIQMPATGGKDLQARCLNEARATMDIQSNNVVRAFDVGSLPTGQLYIVMEYLVGMDLDALIASDGPLPWSRVAYVAIQICNGLAAAHRLGIIHRDIKPQNCFHIAIDGQDDQIKIIDFGVARDSTSTVGITQEGFLLGTPEYTAPELVKGESKANERTDIYALGVTLYKLLTGTVPYRGQDAQETLARHVRDPLIPPSIRSPHLEIPAVADEIISKALAKEPRARFASADDLASSICAALNIQRTGLTLRLPPMPADSPMASATAARQPPAPSRSATAHRQGTVAAPLPAVIPATKLKATSGVIDDADRRAPPRIDTKVLMLRGATLFSLALSFVTGTWLVSPRETNLVPEPPPVVATETGAPSKVLVTDSVPPRELNPPPAPEPEPVPVPVEPESPLPPTDPAPTPDPAVTGEPGPVVEPEVPPPVVESPSPPLEAPAPTAPTQPERNFGYEAAGKLIADEHTYLRNECMAKAKHPAQQVRFRVDVRANGRPAVKVFSSDAHVRKCVKDLLRFPFDPSPRGGAFKYTLTTTTADLQKVPLDPAFLK